MSTRISSEDVARDLLRRSAEGVHPSGIDLDDVRSRVRDRRRRRRSRTAGAAGVAVALAAVVVAVVAVRPTVTTLAATQPGGPESPSTSSATASTTATTAEVLSPPHESSAADLAFWEPLGANGGLDEVEGYDSLLAMTAAADGVVLGHVTRVAEEQVTLVVDMVIAGDVPHVGDGPLTITIDPIPGLMATSDPPAGQVVAFLRRHDDLQKGSYRLVDMTGLWLQSEGRVMAPLSAESLTDDLPYAAELRGISSLAQLIDRVLETTARWTLVPELGEVEIGDATWSIGRRTDGRAAVLRYRTPAQTSATGSVMSRVYELPGFEPTFLGAVGDDVYVLTQGEGQEDSLVVRIRPDGTEFAMTGRIYPGSNDPSRQERYSSLSAWFRSVGVDPVELPDWDINLGGAAPVPLGMVFGSDDGRLLVGEPDGHVANLDRETLEIYPTADTPLLPQESALLNSVRAFALGDPDARVPFSPDGVDVWLGQGLATRIDSDALDDPASWTVPLDGAFGRDGDVSALDLLAGASTLQAVNQDHASCAGAIASRPPGLESDTRLAWVSVLEPGQSCLDWFSVDLYLDDRGVVTAVQVYLWEP